MAGCLKEYRVTKGAAQDRVLGVSKVGDELKQGSSSLNGCYAKLQAKRKERFVVLVAIGVKRDFLKRSMATKESE